MKAGLAGKAEHLRALHHRERPLVLPNVWDVASARLVAENGFPVLATSSAAVSQSLGYADNDSMPPDQAFAVVARIAGAVDLPVTADVEAGYQLSSPELVARLLEAGAVGLNLEDTDHHGGGELLAAEDQAQRIAAAKVAAKKAGVNVVLNARVDIFRGKSEPTPELMAEAIRRARLYIAAGADCVYPITLGDEHAIAEFVAAIRAPVNILLRPGVPTPERLAAMGVARISLAGSLFRTTYAALSDALERLRHDLGVVGPA